MRKIHENKGKYRLARKTVKDENNNGNDKVSNMHRAG